MNTIYKKLFRVFTVVMLIVSVHWLITATVQLSGALPILLFLFTLVIVVLIKCPKLVSKIYQLLVAYKFWLLILVVIYQLVILLVTNLMIRSDSAMVFNGAMKLVDAETISLYLSRYPNNLLLFLYERFFYNLFGMNAIWVMQVLNIFYALVPAYMLHQIAKKHFDDVTANITYFFYLAFLGFSPQFVTMYTDIMVIPILALQLHFALELFYQRHSTPALLSMNGLSLAFFTALGILIRPTLIILPIAVFFVQLFSKNIKKYAIIFAIFLLGFGASYATLKFFRDSQKEVVLNKEYSITALAYIDLGLTYIGTDQIDFQAGLSTFVTDETRVDEYYDGRFSNEVVMKDIKRRLSEYTPTMFVAHLIQKQVGLVRDGTLGWNYKDASKEGAFFINPLYEKTKDNRFATLIRNYLIYTDVEGDPYQYYRYGIQFIFILLVLGFTIHFVRFDEDKKSQILALSVFGGFLFLMIFEGGKGRYLIQFLPQILILSGLGYSKMLSRWKGVINK
ncbi:TPA: hypothetical protein ACHVAK_001838 [Streptococcus suis]